MEIFFDELKQLCNKEEVNLLELQYTEAFKKLQNALDALQKEYISLEDENPIIHMKYRVKKEESILEKLSKKQKEYTISNIKDNVSDIIGARIVCTFKSDIIGSEKNPGMLERLKEKLKDDYQIEILNEKDYISHPKEKDCHLSNDSLLKNLIFLICTHHSNPDIVYMQDHHLN